MKLITQLSLMALLLTSFSTFAQDADPATLPNDPFATEETREEEENKGVQISGFADAYYQMAFREKDDKNLVFPTSFTGRTNEFALGMANVTFAKEMEKVSFVAQLGFGPRAEAANGDVPAIQQLYVTYSPSDAITFTLGNFGTFVGYEVIDPVNVNYSTSYLFSNGPFFHTGLKVDFAIAEGFGAMIGVFNDTDSKFDGITGKHLGGQLSYEAGGLAAYLNVLTGTEADLEGDDDLVGFQLDLTAAYEVNDKLMFGLNVSDKTSAVDGNTLTGFTGAALYSTIGVSDAFALGLRGEYFAGKLPEGVTGDTPGVTAFTLSGNFSVGDLMIIPELRFDSGSNGTTFPFEDGSSSSEESAASFILAGVYSF